MNHEDSPNQKFIIFIGGLNFETDEASIKLFFSSKSIEISPDNIRICRRIEGTSKGFGYITFDNKNAYTKSLSLNGSLLDGMILRIEAHSNKKNTPLIENERKKSNGSNGSRKSKSRTTSDSYSYSASSYSYSSVSSYSSYSSDNEDKPKKSRKRHQKNQKRKQRDYSDYSYSS